MTTTIVNNRPQQQQKLYSFARFAFRDFGDRRLQRNLHF